MQYVFCVYRNTSTALFYTRGQKSEVVLWVTSSGGTRDITEGGQRARLEDHRKSFSVTIFALILAPTTFVSEIDKEVFPSS